MKLGIYINKFGRSNFSQQIITSLNNLTKTIEVIAFYHSFDVLPITPLFPLLQEKWIWGYDGPVLCFDLSTAKTLINCPGPKHKILYMSNLEWINSTYNFQYLQNIYQNDTLHLLANSDEDFKLITNCWKQPMGIVENFNYEQIYKIIERL